MKLTLKVLYATLAMVIMGLMILGPHIVSLNQANQQAHEIAENITKLEQEEQVRIAHKLLVREERWMTEIGCLARNVYYESRGESREGQLAVALVTINRTENKMFPNSICGVVNERKKSKGELVCQFSWRCEAHTNPKKTVRQQHESYQVALQAIQQYDYLSTRLVPKDTYWFHANYVRPSWRKVKQRIARIDNHIFYKQKPGDRRR